MTVTFKVLVSPFGPFSRTRAAILVSGLFFFFQFQRDAKQSALENQSHLHPGTKTKF